MAKSTKFGQCFLFVIVFFAMTQRLNAQVRDLDNFGNPIQTPTIDTTFNPEDTIINRNGFLSIFTGKPGRAALYGLLIPSGGQIYNKKWWKVPIALGIDGAFTYVVINNRRVYTSERDRYFEIINDENHPDRRLLGQIEQKRNQYRKWSEMSWVWLALGHIFTVMDAYVDRHMMDFDISPDISLQYHPETGQMWAAELKMNIPIVQFYEYSKKPKKAPNPLILSY